MTTDANPQIPAGAHPQAADALHQLQQLNSALSDQMHQITNSSFTGTDEGKTVEVTVDGTKWLKTVYIEDGLLRLGAETVAERINEALHNAQASATEALQVQQAELMENLSSITNSLVDGLEMKK